MKKSRFSVAIILISCLILSAFPNCSYQPKIKVDLNEQSANLRASENQFDSTRGYSYVHFHASSSFSIQFPSKSWDGTLEFFNSKGSWEAITGKKSISSRSYGFSHNGKRYTQAILLRGKNNTTITSANKENAWKFTGAKIEVVGGGLSALLNYGKPSSINAEQFAYLFDGITTIEQKDLESLGYTQSVSEPLSLLTPEEIDAMDDSLFVEDSTPSVRRQIVEDILLGTSPILTEEDCKNSIEEMFVEDANANSNSKLNLKLNSSQASIKITNKKLIGSLKNNIDTSKLKLKLNTQDSNNNYLQDDVKIESLDITLPSGKKAVAFVSNNKYIGDVLYYSELPEDGSDITKTKGYEYAIEYSNSILEAYDELCKQFDDEQIIASLIEDFGADLSEYYYELLEYGIDISKYQDVDSAKAQGIESDTIASRGIKDFFKGLADKLDIYEVKYGDWHTYEINPMLEKDKIHLQQSTYENDILDEYYKTKGYVTGCTNTAMGMVAIYNEYPKLKLTYRDFEEDKVYDIGYKEVKRFLRGDEGQSEGEKRAAQRAIGYIMYAFGKEFESKYKVGGTGTQTGKGEGFEKGIKNFGYKVDSNDGKWIGNNLKKAPKPSLIIESLEKDYPVLATVSTENKKYKDEHSVVIDGVKYETRKKVEKIFRAKKHSREYKLKMVHIDFGWDDILEHNGWYDVGNDLKFINHSKSARVDGKDVIYKRILQVIKLEPKNKSDRSYDNKFAFPRAEDKAEGSYEWANFYPELVDYHDGEDNEYMRTYTRSLGVGVGFYVQPFVVGARSKFPYWNLSGRYIAPTASEVVAYKNAWRWCGDNKLLPPSKIVDKDIDKWLSEHNYFKLKNSNVWFKGFKNIADARKFYSGLKGTDGISKSVEYVPIINDSGNLIGYHRGINSNSMIDVKKDVRNWICITSDKYFWIESDLLKKDENKNIDIEYAVIPVTDTCATIVETKEDLDNCFAVDNNLSAFDLNSNSFVDKIEWKKWDGSYLTCMLTGDSGCCFLLLRAKNNTLIGSKDGGRWIFDYANLNSDKPANVEIKGKIGCFINYENASLEYEDVTNSMYYKLGEYSSYNSLNNFTNKFDEIVKKKIGVSSVRVDISEIGLNMYDRKKQYYYDAGQSIQFKAWVDCKNPSDPRATKVVWSSSNPSLAKVDEKGCVTMLMAGDVTITATSLIDNTIFDSVNIKIADTEKVDIVPRYSDSEDEIYQGQSIWHYFNIYTTSSKSPYNKRADYIVESSDTSIAEVESYKSGDYVITGKSAGSVTISIYHKNNKSKRCEYQMKVKKVNIKSLTLSKSSLTLSKDSTDFLKAQVTADVQPNEFSGVYTDFSWVSSNPSVVSVDRSGNIKALSKGSATITAVSLIDSSKKASCKITVK